MRTFVIGDIHGCSKALRTVIEEIAPTADDTLVFLGDYIDRGPDSRDVVDQVIDLSKRCKTITLRGNHEVMLVNVLKHSADDETWMKNGGRATVASYGGSLDRIPASHLRFYSELLPFYETDHSIFVHANYDATLTMEEQQPVVSFWTHLSISVPGPHCSGKRVYVGHTPQPDGEIWDMGHLLCLDTYCFGGGYLTAYQLENANQIQADRHGHLRRAPIALIAERLRKIRFKFTRSIKKKADDK